LERTQGFGGEFGIYIEDHFESNFIFKNILKRNGDVENIIENTLGTIFSIPFYSKIFKPPSHTTRGK
jgi:hypothetical protein